MVSAEHWPDTTKAVRLPCSVYDTPRKRPRCEDSALGWTLLLLSISERVWCATIRGMGILKLRSWQSNCTNTRESVGHDRRILTSLPVTNREAVMWMRSCALCKAILRKCHLSETVRCQCGWQW